MRVNPICFTNGSGQKIFLDPLDICQVMSDDPNEPECDVITYQGFSFAVIESATEILLQIRFALEEYYQLASGDQNHVLNSPGYRDNGSGPATRL